MKKVSIIIPVYNVEKYLPKCLDSVIGQTYADLEIICVDDGTPDRSAAVILSYAEKDGRIRLISQDNQGLSGARNTGIKSATGEYIVFLDGDDWLEPETIETAVDCIKKENADVVMWGYVREFPEKSTEKMIFDGNRIFDENGSRELHRRMAGLLGDETADPSNADSLATAWGKLYRADIIKNNALEFVDTKLIGTEDALFNLYYFGFVHKAAFINRPFNHYRKDNEVSLTRSYKPRLFAQWNELYDRMERYIKDNNLPKDFYSALDNRICFSMIGLGLTELLNPNRSERIGNIRNFLSTERYRRAFGALKINYLPIHWKVFFIFCKFRCACGVYALIKIMSMIIEK